MKLFKKRKPWVSLQDEVFIPEDYSEIGEPTGAKIENEIVGNQDLSRVFRRYSTGSTPIARNSIKAHTLSTQTTDMLSKASFTTIPS